MGGEGQVSFFRIAAITIVIVAPGIWLVLFLSWLDAKCRAKACREAKDNIKKSR